MLKGHVMFYIFIYGIASVYVDVNYRLCQANYLSHNHQSNETIILPGFVDLYLNESVFSVLIKYSRRVKSWKAE